MTHESLAATRRLCRGILPLRKTDLCTSPLQLEDTKIGSAAKGTLFDVIDESLIYGSLGRPVRLPSSLELLRQAKAVKTEPKVKAYRVKCASYLKPLFDVKAYPKIVETVAAFIARTPISYEAIAFRGMSGALLVPALCAKLGKPMIMVRKKIKGEYEHTHSAFITEGPTQGLHYIIVDDLIASGSTMNSIIEALPHSKCVGIFLWLDNEAIFSPAGWGDNESIKCYSMDVRNSVKIDDTMRDEYDDL